MKKTVRFFSAFLLLLLVFTVSVSAADREFPRLVDEAALLSSGDAEQLLNTLDEISERQQMDVVVVTITGLSDGWNDIASFADAVFDQHFGMGPYEQDGILLLIDMGERAWWMSTGGEGITTFTDYGLAYLEESFLSYLSDGDYYHAFMIYAQTCDSLITQAKNGQPYDDPYGEGIGQIWENENPYWYEDDDYVPYRSEPQAFSSTRVFGSLVFGVILALIIVSAMKGKLKSVRSQSGASAYQTGSLRMHNTNDLFLYRTHTKTPIPRDNDTRSGGGRHSGGSTIHHSSGGVSHGGRGGHF